MKKIMHKSFSKLTKFIKFVSSYEGKISVKIDDTELNLEELKSPKLIYNGDTLRLQFSNHNELKETKKGLLFNGNPFDFFTITEEVFVC